MMTTTIRTTTACLLLLLGVNSLPFQFNEKMCVAFPSNWVLPYSGVYEWGGPGSEVNDEPIYYMRTCDDVNNCKVDMTLSRGANGKWYFGGEPPAEDTTNYHPFCTTATNAPSEICPTKWWPNDPQPEITECGNTHTVPRLVVLDRSLPAPESTESPEDTESTESVSPIFGALPYNFNDKMCVDFPSNGDPSYWMLPYSGDYEWSVGNEINGEPIYTLKTCLYPNNCHQDMTLSRGADGKWYFNGEPADRVNRDPFCTVATNAPSEICQTKWWGPGPNDRQPTITGCGVTQTVPRIIIPTPW